MSTAADDADRTGRDPAAPSSRPLPIDPEPGIDGGELVALRAALEAERAGTEHWRRTAAHRSQVLEELKRRPTVRAALALDHRTAGLRRRAAAAAKRAAAGAARAGVVAGGIGARPAVAGRRTRLHAAVAAAGPPPEGSARPAVVVVGPPVATDRGVPAPAGWGDHELVVADPGAGPVGAALQAAFDSLEPDLVAVVSASAEPLVAGCLERLAAALEEEEGVVAAAALVVHPGRAAASATAHDLLVRAAGLEVVRDPDGVPVVRGRLAGGPVPAGGGPEAVAAVGAVAVVLDRRAVRAAGGVAPLRDADVAVLELCLRLRAAGGRVVCVPSALVADHRPVERRSRLDRPVEDRTDAWRSTVERHGPAVLTPVTGQGPDGPGRASEPAGVGATLRIAVTVAAPNRKVAPRWGDWHLAEGLADGLRRLGHEVRLQTADHADDLAGRVCDLHVVVQGLLSVRRTAGQGHVLWVISHPEDVSVADCDAADLVLVASRRFAEDLRRRTSTPVEVLLQATDAGRFRPLPADPAHRHDVTVVAKSRDVLRPVVADALAAGLRPALYGGGWRGLVDEDLVVADHVPNEELPVVYSSARVVLNDHWDTMRAWGFVSNRLFDVVACGTPVVSDHLPEVAEVFGDLVPTWRTPDELRAEVQRILDDPEGARERAQAARSLVLGAHTFDHRARRLVDLTVRHLDPARRGTMV